jgi:hypothetical protein
MTTLSPLVGRLALIFKLTADGGVIERELRALEGAYPVEDLEVFQQVLQVLLQGEVVYTRTGIAKILAVTLWAPCKAPTAPMVLTDQWAVLRECVRREDAADHSRFQCRNVLFCLAAAYLTRDMAGIACQMLPLASWVPLGAVQGEPDDIALSNKMYGVLGQTREEGDVRWSVFEPCIIDAAIAGSLEMVEKLANYYSDDAPRVKVDIVHNILRLVLCGPDVAPGLGNNGDDIRRLQVLLGQANRFLDVESFNSLMERLVPDTRGFHLRGGGRWAPNPAKVLALRETLTEFLPRGMVLPP